jgi:hypothetical protein
MSNIETVATYHLTHNEQGEVVQTSELITQITFLRKFLCLLK